MSFDPASGTFHLTYVPNHAVHAPTAIFVPAEVHYPNGYCARTSGASIISKTNSETLLLDNARTGRSVSVSVTPGGC